MTEAAKSEASFIHRIIDALAAAGIPFMVAGSYACSTHGEPRTTNDVDLIIDPEPAQLDAFLARLGEDAYVSREAALQAVRLRSMFNVIDLVSGLKADLIVRKNRPFSISEFGRRAEGRLLDRLLPIVTAEDLMLSKLEWNRITPSDRQLRDVVGVAKVNRATLDLAYLRQWATVLGVGDMLEEALRQACVQQPGE